MIKTNRLLTFAGLAGLGTILLMSARTEKTVTRFHTPEEVAMFGMLSANLPNGSNSLFTGSGRCAGCHGFDPDGVASVTAEGQDVNVTDDWRSTMMANSAKDPFWRAKVSHEVAVNPSHQQELEDKCTSCHAPMGRFAAIHDGLDHYSMAMLMTDSLGLDGVSCNACHQQDPGNIGNFFSGELEFVEDTLYGPFGGDPEEAPIFGSPMISFVGYEPLFGEHTLKSEACAGCHTLLTNTVDLDGELTGEKFVEQATYHEWLNSQYSIEATAVECQGCHMPTVNEPIVISSGYAFLPPRDGFAQHYFVGANTFMLGLLKNNIDELGLAATEEQFDRTIARTMDMLVNQSVEFEISDPYVEDDTLICEVSLLNIAGHKFPSGYPARRMFIEFVVTDDEGNTLWASGVPQADYEVQGQDPIYEPHYDVITEEDEVQIYEMVMGDVNGNVTTVLERADMHLKDNRLTPIGFSTTHAAYDTTMIVGGAATDPNFNHDEFGVEGNGGDKITYKAALNGYGGEINVTARLHYQSAPPKWMDEMFSISTPEIDTFKQMYEAEGADPVMIDEEIASLTHVGINPVAWNKQARIYPNPSGPEGVWLEVPANTRVSLINVYDQRGRRVQQLANPTGNRIRIPMDLPQGTYVVEVLGADGLRMIERVVR